MLLVISLYLNLPTNFFEEAKKLSAAEPRPIFTRHRSLIPGCSGIAELCLVSFTSDDFGRVQLGDPGQRPAPDNNGNTLMRIMYIMLNR